jgi:hypothetical protein
MRSLNRDGSVCRFASEFFAVRIQVDCFGGGGGKELMDLTVNFGEPLRAGAAVASVGG